MRTISTHMPPQSSTVEAEVRKPFILKMNPRSLICFPFPDEARMYQTPNVNFYFDMEENRLQSNSCDESGAFRQMKGRTFARRSGWGLRLDAGGDLQMRRRKGVPLQRKSIENSMKRMLNYLTKLNAYRIERFDGNNFKRWKDMVLDVLDFSKISFVLTEPVPDENTENYAQKLEAWNAANKFCLSTIRNALSDDLYGIYNHFTLAKAFWDELVSKYEFEDEDMKKFLAVNFLQYQVSDDKSVETQINDFQNIINGLAKEGDCLPERFKTQCLVEKLPDSWKEFKLKFRQKRHAMTLQETIVYIKVEAQNRKLQMTGRAKEMMSKANVVEVGPAKPQQSQN
ncbi:hypothetical protein RJ639_040370 [Escallonia herrerae]|uniref:Uncharacterized protein n=1 Tax=Escallonia herrerae TaxID=1293975 RepID=A0AA88WJ40_9ASTE|nr:hypothetical protein RJ639_040370 [Escallonia herrerae]